MCLIWKVVHWSGAIRPKGVRILVARSVYAIDGAEYPSLTIAVTLTLTVTLATTLIANVYPAFVAEIAFGLSVNGFVHPDKVLRKGPPNLDEVLILTKPLCEGTENRADGLALPCLLLWL